MQIDEQTFKKMPPHLQALFVKDANPARDEVVGAFPTTGGGGTPRKASPNEGSAWAIGAERSSIPGGATYCDSGSAARFFYSAKASKADRAGSKHPTVKPIALMQWLARLITPPGGTVLDPFAGSGTTGAAAKAEGFRTILIEREDEYVADIRRRLDLPGAVPLDASEPTQAGRRISHIFADEKGIKSGRLDRFNIAPLLREYRRQQQIAATVQAALYA